MNKEDLKKKRDEIIRDSRRIRNQKYYQDNKEKNKTTCPYCYISVDKHYFDRHCETKIHMRMVERSKNSE